MELTITWHGGATVRIRGPFGTVVCEPPDGAATLAGADIATVALPEPFLGQSPEPGGSDGPYLVRGPGEYEVRGVFIVGVPTPGPADAPFNTAYALTFDQVTVCHLGQAVAAPRDEDAADLGAIDVLILPLGGPRALQPTRAAEIVGELAPRIVAPVVVDAGGDVLGQFLSELGAGPMDPVAELRVQPLPATDDVQVVLLTEHAPPA